MTKGLGISKEDRLSLVCFVRFGGLPESELCTLQAILNHSDSLSLDLSTEVSEVICQSINQSLSFFKANTYRLVKRGIIKKSGKVITIHPILNDLDSLEKLVISFV